MPGAILGTRLYRMKPNRRDDRKMTADDAAKKAGHQAQKVKGKVKEKVGAATGDRSTELKGEKDKTAGSLKKAGDEVKDAAKGR